jgi:acetolactate synthase-1/2/3 large subunit
LAQRTRREVADALVAAAKQRGARFAFGVPGGGSNLDVAGACRDHEVRFVLAHQEASAAIMAGVVGELTGAPGIAVATRGPGAACSSNGVANALLERAPMVMITDCVSAADAHRVSHQRFDQQAFLGPVSLFSVAWNGERLAAAAELVDASVVQPPGPVHVDIDPAAATVQIPRREAAERSDPRPLVDALSGSSHPVIIAGLGLTTLPEVEMERAVTALNDLAARTHIPILTTYKARGVVPDGSEYSAGVVTGGTVEAPLLRESDLIIGIGFDPVELLPTAWDYEAPVVLAGTWRIDDADFFGEHLRAQVVGDLAELIDHAGASVRSEWTPGTGALAWSRLLAATRAGNAAGGSDLTPGLVVELASRHSPANSIATVDAGAHMLVCVPLWEVTQPQRVLISSGYATMGYSLPAAIAAALVHPEAPVVAFTGDGGLGMTLAELETLSRLNLPVVVVVFNDSLLTLIALKQNPAVQGGADAVQYASTDFAQIASGFGIRSWRVQSAAEYETAIREALASGRPALVDALVDPAPYGGIYRALRE